MRALFPLSMTMHEYETPAGPGYFSRSEVELELAHIALRVMRASPETYGDAVAPVDCVQPSALPDQCKQLLMRTRPEHRPFVEDRLRELARSLSGRGEFASHEWLQVAIEAPSARVHKDDNARR